MFRFKSRHCFTAVFLHLMILMLAPTIVPPRPGVFEGLSFVSDAQAQEAPTIPPENKESNYSLSPFTLLLIIVFGGAFGGFVDGLRRESTYAISFRKKTLCIGSAGDLLVGATAAIAIFTVADSVFQITLEFQSNAAKDFVKLVAWSVLSGYVGPRLLNPLSERLVRQLAASAAREEIKRDTTTAKDMHIHLRKGESKLFEYDAMGGPGSFSSPGFDMAKAKRLLQEAMNSYELARELSPIDKQVLLGTSSVLRRQAQLTGHEGNKKEEDALWERAISFLDTAISTDPNSPKAYYNRACYRVVSAISKDAAREDLEEAFRLQPGLKATAKTDTDFNSVRGENWFIDMVG